MILKVTLLNVSKTKRIKEFEKKIYKETHISKWKPNYRKLQVNTDEILCIFIVLKILEKKTENTTFTSNVPSLSRLHQKKEAQIRVNEAKNKKKKENYLCVCFFFLSYEFTFNLQKDAIYLHYNLSFKLVKVILCLL